MDYVEYSDHTLPADRHPLRPTRAIDLRAMPLELEVAVGPSVHDALDALVRLVEQQAPALRGSILLLDDDGHTLRHGAAPSLPPSFCAAVDGARVGPASGSCGTAAHRRERVVVRDIATDPLWEDFRGVALAHGLAACWSTPIFGRDGRLLGTFAMYYDEPREPTAADEALTATSTLLAASIIERSRAEMALVDREARLRLQAMELLARARAAEDDAQALAESEARFRFLAEAIPVQVWTAGPDGKLDFVTDQGARAIGQPATQLLGDGWISAVHPEDLERAGAKWAQSLATGERYENEGRIYSAQHGAYRWHLTRADAQRDAGGTIVKWFGTNTDIEEQKQVEAARDAALAAAEQANLARARLMSTISHELRTPIGAIGGFVELLLMELRGPLADAQRVDLDRVRRNVKHLGRLIDDLLLLAKLEAGQLPVVCRPIPVGDALAAAHAMVEPQLLAKSIRYDTDAVGPDLVAIADADRVQQIVINLVANGIKFTAAGGSIAIAAERVADQVLVRVADTGAGIPPDMLERVFEPFVQADHDARGASGTGLGLAISRELARRMSGDLTATSTVGRGSRFTLSLPAANP